MKATEAAKIALHEGSLLEGEPGFEEMTLQMLTLLRQIEVDDDWRVVPEGDIALAEEYQGVYQLSPDKPPVSTTGTVAVTLPADWASFRDGPAVALKFLTLYDPLTHTLKENNHFLFPFLDWVMRVLALVGELAKARAINRGGENVHLGLA